MLLITTRQITETSPTHSVWIAKVRQTLECGLGGKWDKPQGMELRHRSISYYRRTPGAVSITIRPSSATIKGHPLSQKSHDIFKEIEIESESVFQGRC
jgi:hypothetical protein